MNKKQVIEAIAHKAHQESEVLKKTDISKVLNYFFDVVKEQLQDGEKVDLTGFGSFYTADRPERQGRNPATGEAITIPATTVAKCKLSKTLLASE